MKRTFKYKVKRALQYLRVKFLQQFKTNRRSKYPKKVSKSEKVASEIFIKLLHNHNSKLYYDLESHECYLKSSDANLYIFLESENMKVINSIYGYDIRISSDLQVYLVDRFKHEMSKRRKAFKDEAISKVSHSLDKTLEKIIKTSDI